MLAATDYDETASPGPPSCLEDRPASPLQRRVNAMVRQTIDGSGLSSSAVLATLGPDGSWQRTPQGYSQLTLDGSSEPFSESWPRWGIVSAGQLMALTPWVPRTDASGSSSSATTQGSARPTPTAQNGKHGTPTDWEQEHRSAHLHVMAAWPTPSAQDGTGGKIHAGISPTGLMADGTKRQVSLNHAAKMQWPTPRATDGSKGGPNQRGSKGDLMLPSAVQVSAKPTPTTQDAHNTGSQSQQARNTPPLNAAVGGSLNPAWVACLMGLPSDWCDVD